MLFSKTPLSLNRTLSRDLILSLTGIVLIFVVAGSLWYQSKSARQLEQELQSQATLLIEKISGIISFPLLKGDEQTLGHIARAFTEGNDYIAGIQIENKAGKIIVDTISDQHPFRFSKEKTLTDKHGTAGSLMVVFTDVKLRQVQQDTMRTALLVTLFIFVVTAAAIYLFMHLWLNRPIDELSREIRRITDGKHKGTLPLPPQKELAAIADEINKMTEQIIQKNKALELSEQKYLSIFNNAHEGIFQTTADGKLLTVNPALARIMGYETPEQIIEYASDIGQQFYVDRQERADMMEVLTRQGIISNFTTRVYHRNGLILWGSLNVQAVYNEDGSIRFLEGTLDDITTKKELENDLAQARKMEAIGTIASGIAHDFNNILSAIFSHIEMAQAAAGTNDNVRKSLNNAMKGVKRAQELTRQILSFKRKESQQKILFPVAPIVKEALQLLRSSIPPSIEIEKTIHSSAAIVADPTSLHQVVMNLYANACQAMEQQTGILNVTLEDTILDREQADELKLLPGKYIILEVSDTGRGMDQKTLAKMFKPYFTTRSDKKGTGLGLAIVKRLVQECGGKIAVESEPGKGTSFRVYLPAAEEKSSSPVVEKSGRVQSVGKGEQVLIVDDEPMIREILSTLLSENGYRPTCQSSSPAALQMIAAQPERWDLLITDMTMPEMTGEILAKKVLKLRPNLPIILCTGYSTEMNKVKARDIGIQAYIQKPVLVTHLLSRIRSLLDRTETGASG